MNYLCRFLLLTLLLSSTHVLALPPRQHLAKGPVAALERDKITLALSRPDKDEPASFAIQEGRTRFRKDGEKATADQLSVGQSVRLCYKKEMGVWVATEVTWKSEEPAKNENVGEASRANPTCAVRPCAVARQELRGRWQ